jgi:alkyl hydroperoxide reductase subunit AhpC
VIHFWPKDLTFVWPDRDRRLRQDRPLALRRQPRLAGRHARRALALRATFIVDPDNVVQHVSVNNLNVGRNSDEVLCILDGLQTDELCTCNCGVGGSTL